jgi:hypothetical protein
VKRFDSYEDLIKYIGVDSPENIIGLKNVLNRYLERHGSNLMKSKDEEPRTCFKVEIENTMYGIGVTSVEIKENVFDYYYWLMENEQDKLKYKYERSNSSHNSENTYILCMFIFVILGLFMVMAI